MVVKFNRKTCLSHISTNRLAQTTSPYLLQHAHNPVDWFPWGDEAFAKARAENKPIFLSIGYSACHWCHVMERESFEDPAIAAFLAEHFVSIKVDREERPDVDDIYMTAVQMIAGSGGWPLTVFLAPDLKPFYGGTYFPPEDRHGRPGFMRLLEMIDDAWRNRPADVAKSAEHLTEALQKNAALESGSDVAATIADVDHAARLVAGGFDPFRGGFGEAPKFPPTAQMELLLRVWRRNTPPSPPPQAGGEREALPQAEVDKRGNEYLEMVERTLQRMSAGGIFDQLAGGFARYSTDADWLVPHFEKMLYDNALLTVNLIECYQATGKPEYLTTARHTLDWALTEMRDEAGGFHSALDADSEGVEGKYYVWKPAQIAEILGDDDADLFCAVYDVGDHGNFEHGDSILHVAMPFKEAALRYKLDEAELGLRLEVMRQKLLTERNKRIRPAKDDKVLTDWNSLMITALARGYRATDDERYLSAAQEAASFIRGKMWREGRLMHSFRDGKSGAEGLLDDHAYYLAALIELYQADFDPGHLAEAEKVVLQLKKLFLDAGSGGFFLAPAGKTDLITRTKHGHDGATPSGNALIAASLVALYQLLDRDDFRQLASDIVAAFGLTMKRNPAAHLRLYVVAESLATPSSQVAIVGDNKDPLVRNLLSIINSGYHPTLVVACGQQDSPGLPLLRGREMVGGKPAAYFCRNFVCEAPVADPAALRSLLN